MATKLYVGNLPFKTGEEELQALFAQHGTVQSVNLIRDRLSGQSRGFGFVEMTSEDEAEKAIQSLNGHDMDGRQITVNEARPQRPREGGGGRDPRGNRGGRPRDA